MNPQSNDQAGFHLPAPMTEQTPPTVPGAPLSSVAPFSVPLPGAPRPSTVLPVPAPVPLASPLVSAGASASGVGSNGGDEIQAAWVQKAKAIILRTHQDPYERSQEIAKLRADYLQRNYNKTLKTEQS